MNNTKKLVLSAFFVSLGIVLPFFTAQLPQIGNMLLPMHIPVIICGFVCGSPYGFIVGFTVPLLRSILFGRPVMVPNAIGMSVELAVYGLVTGFMYTILKHKKWGIYATLITSMIVGRIAWGIVNFFLYRVLGSPFTWKIFVTEAFVNAVPGIMIQLILIPLLIYALNKSTLLNPE